MPAARKLVAAYDDTATRIGEFSAAATSLVAQLLQSRKSTTPFYLHTFGTRLT